MEKQINHTLKKTFQPVEIKLYAYDSRNLMTQSVATAAFFSEEDDVRRYKISNNKTDKNA